jgi:hypothetical protein
LKILFYVSSIVFFVLSMYGCGNGNNSTAPIPINPENGGRSNAASPVTTTAGGSGYLVVDTQLYYIARVYGIIDVYVYTLDGKIVDRGYGTSDTFSISTNSPYAGINSGDDISHGNKSTTQQKGSFGFDDFYADAVNGSSPTFNITVSTSDLGSATQSPFLWFDGTGSEEGTAPGTVACSPTFDRSLYPNSHYVALPYDDSTTTPCKQNIKVFNNNDSSPLFSEGPVWDQGPWFGDPPSRPQNGCSYADPYWNVGNQPQAETEEGPASAGNCSGNFASIDLSDQMGSDINLGGLGKVDWRFVGSIGSAP